MNPQPPPLPKSPPPIASRPPVMPRSATLDLRSISGAERMTVAEVHHAVAAGGRFVLYQYAISVLILSFKRSSGIMFIPAGESAFVKGIPYSLLSLVAGWWGIPWGPIWTIMTLVTNCGGGKDLTPQVLAALGGAMPIPGSIPPPMPVSPTEAAARAERESRRKLVRGLAFAGVAVLVLFGIFGLFKILGGGGPGSKEPGAAELRHATKLIGSEGIAASGNNDEARRLAGEMNKLMQAYRDRNYTQATRPSLLNAIDHNFRTYCDLRNGHCVFLIHVPDLRRFNAKAKESLAAGGWIFAKRLVAKNGEPVDLAVGLQGIDLYDRVLIGKYTADEGVSSPVKPAVYDGFSPEKQLVSWFAPQPSAPTQGSVPDVQSNATAQ